MADKFPCHHCKKNVSKTKSDRYRTHTDGDGQSCEMSSVEIPAHILEAGPVDPKQPADVPVEGVDYAQCPQCTRKVRLTRLGYFESHDETLRGSDRCAVSGVRYEHARKQQDVPLPGDALGASPVPKVRDSQTPAANRGITSPVPGSVSVSADDTRTAPSTPGGGLTAPSCAPAPAEPATATAETSALSTGRSEIDWSDVDEGTGAPGGLDVPAAPVVRPEGKAEPEWRNGATIDWSKVGDLKYLPDELEEKEAEKEEFARLAGSSASTESSSLESPTTLTPSPKSWAGSERSATPNSSGELPDDAPSEIFSLGVTVSDRFLQPASPFLQPAIVLNADAPLPLMTDGTGVTIPSADTPSRFLQPPEYGGPVKGEPMGELAKELSAKIDETFYAYSNRKTKDNRSAQTTLGPSEIGTPCDRRLAMALMGVPAVNPGGDGWAAFVGTWTHQGMAEVYTFADAGTGRYAVELPVFLGMPTVPRGTTDLLDRRDGTVVDWKVMGAYSLKKFKQEGPSATYRTQAHVYGLGAERAGEKVRNVAIVGLPRAGRSLDEKHIWTEKFDKKFAQAALDRVERIARNVADIQATEQPDPMKVAAEFEPADDCTYCPFYLKGDKEMTRGCPGK